MFRKIFPIFATHIQPFKMPSVMERTRTKSMTVRLPEYAVDSIKKEAKRRNMSMSRLMSICILDSLCPTPPPETLAALEECRSGVELEELTSYDIEHFEEYLARL